MKKENWETIPVPKNEDVNPGNWTFKRCAGQNLIWALFGNDRDGCEPYYNDRKWSFWKWWLRNRCSNFKWYVIGYGWWEEGNPWAAWKVEHLQIKDIISKKWLQIHIIKPRKRGFLYWRPFISFTPWKLDIHFGWRKRGQFAVSILWDKEG